MLGWKGLEHTSIHKACNIFRFRPRRFFKISLSQFVEPESKKAKDMFRKLKYFLSQKVKSGVQHQFASTCVLHRNELTSFHRWTECQRDSGRYNKRSYFVQKQGYKKQVLNLPLNFGTYGREMGQVHNPIHNLLKKKWAVCQPHSALLYMVNLYTHLDMLYMVLQLPFCIAWDVVYQIKTNSTF